MLSGRGFPAQRGGPLLVPPRAAGYRPGGAEGTVGDAHGWSVLAFGLVVASISAFFAIWSLMRILERFTAWPFVIYRALLGVALLVGAATGWLI
jgi:undecaprenyl pyrophosphate phosphatase UppP